VGHNLLGLEVVLPDGHAPARFGGENMKDVAGYDTKKSCESGPLQGHHSTVDALDRPGGQHARWRTSPPPRPRDRSLCVDTASASVKVVRVLGGCTPAIDCSVGRRR
jgi:hypothetical protein